MTYRPLALTILSASTVLLAACAAAPQRSAAPAAPVAKRQASEAAVNLASASGSLVSGRLVLAPLSDGLHLRGEVGGLMPGSRHGFHIHEKGDCSSGDGMSAGGHFNPGGKPHGHHGKGEHHTGDLPSLKADANGTVSFQFESRSIRVGSTANDIVGKGLIVHRDPDDYTTQPTGNAGPRLACAVITAK